MRNPRRSLRLLAPLAVVAAAFGLGACATTDTSADASADHPFEPNDVQLLDPHHIYRTMPPGD
jgi:hypothetical protein